MKIFKTVILIILSAAISAVCAAVLASCAGNNETTTEITAPLSDTAAQITTAPDTTGAAEVTAKEPKELPEYTVSDAILPDNKTLTVTKTSVILKMDLGYEKTVVLSKEDISMQMEELKELGYYVVTFTDKTGNSVTVYLTPKDYGKVFMWVYGL